MMSHRSSATRSAWLPAVSLAALLFAAPNAAVAAQNCTVAKDPNTLDALMQGLGGASAVVLLVSKEGPVWARMAAAAGLASAAWSAAKTYFEKNQQPTICIDTFPSAPPQIYVGPPSLVDSLSSNDALSTNSQSPTMQQLVRRLSLDKSLSWTQLCSDLTNCFHEINNNPPARFAPDSGAR